MRIKVPYIALVAVVMLAILMGGSCKKARIQTVGGVIKFSVDTLKFDTVFTAAGSFTTGLLIYNPQNEEVVLSSVSLAEGANSYFHLNVDGFAGNTATNIKIPAHDSIYVFATVKIDPNNKFTPFLVTDSLVATMNGKNFYVGFTAYGQNAHYIIDSALAGPIGSIVPWKTDLPYVIIWTGDTSKPHGLQINPGVTLSLPAGCRVYMHQNASVAVFGTLVSNGTKTDSVIFQGDRLDRIYFGYMGYPGEWGGIYFDSKSTGSKLTHTIIENCGNGSLTGVPAAIQIAPDSATAPQLILDRCIIQNSYGYGIYNFGGTLVAKNSLINTTGQEALAVVEGGTVTATNCTFANYGSSAVSHANYGTVTILNYYWDGVGGDLPVYATLSANLTNCIVYGSLDSEVIFDAATVPSGTTASLTLNHCLLKKGTILESFVDTTGCIFNQDPLFKNTANADFHLMSGSPAIGAGDSTTIVTSGDSDLEDNPWVGGDIGCYRH